jgi:hypothetical protein
MVKSTCRTGRNLISGISVLYRSFTAWLQQAGVQDDKIQGFAKVSNFEVCCESLLMGISENFCIMIRHLHTISYTCSFIVGFLKK